MDVFKRQDSRFIAAETAKHVKVFRNGNHSRQAEIMIKPGATFQQLREEISAKLGLRDTGVFKLYNSEGIELYDDYIPLIRDEERLFVSLGEEFDQNTSLAEYKEISLLGEGGFGKVLLMEHGTAGQLYAVKFVNAKKYGLASLIDMVFKEAELLKNLNHRNIVEIVNFFTLRDMRVVFVMEYLQGGELGEYLQKKGKLTEEEAREIFIQLVEAVNFCHNNNIIHRDLKLENILFESKDSNKIKVVDFGIAGFYSNMKGSESSAGSIRYMAPEVLTGRNKAANPGIDIWSMGVILHTLLHGSLPFNGKTKKEIIERIVYGKHEVSPEVRKNVSLECQDLLAKMLVVDYKSRITTFEVTQHPWVLGKKNVFAPSWYDGDKLEQSKVVKEEGKRNSFTIKTGQVKILSHVKSKASLGGNEKEIVSKVVVGSESLSKKTSNKEIGSARDQIVVKEKKSLMYEEAKRRERKLHTIEAFGKEEVASPMAKFMKEKKMTLPCLPTSPLNGVKLSSRGTKKGFFN